MIPVDTNSMSEIIRATAILLIQLARVEPQPWQEEGPDRWRMVTLAVDVKQVFKGEVRSREARLTVRQNRPRASMDYPGLWSTVPLEQGAELVAFSKTVSSDPAELIRDDDTCERLLPASQALADVRAAAGSEDGDADFAEVARQAWTERAQRGGIYARWLWDRIRPEAMRSLSGFDVIAKLIEDPQTSPAGREAYIQAAYQGLSEAQVPAQRQRARLALALVSLLQLQAAQGMRSNLVRTLLPNLLGLDGPQPMRSAVVFEKRPEARALALAVLRAEPASAQRDRLLQWLSPSPPPR